MRKLYSEQACSGVSDIPFLLFCALLALAITGCGGGGPDKSDANVINETDLPTTTQFNKQCEDVGIFGEPCVLDDNSNPFRTTVILEYDEENPDADTKFDQEKQLIPPDQKYAISRFYFWATALARRPDIGENQFLTARALHELYTAGGGENGGSENAREQALRAYRSLLDNYFGSAIFAGPFVDPNDPEEEVFIPIDLSQLTAQLLVIPPPEFDTLYPGDDPELSAKVDLGEWGYTYVPPVPVPEGEDEPLPTLIPINFVPIQF
jgi:hypothetical protein